MQPDAPALIWDAHRAARLVREFITGRGAVEYESDAMLRSAVERQFEIVGEALNKLSKADPETAAQVPDLPRLVAFRNILIHGYATIDSAIVWEFATSKVDGLIAALDGMLEDVQRP